MTWRPEGTYCAVCGAMLFEDLAECDECGAQLFWIVEHCHGYRELHPLEAIDYGAITCSTCGSRVAADELSVVDLGIIRINVDESSSAA